MIALGGITAIVAVALAILIAVAVENDKYRGARR